MLAILPLAISALEHHQRGLQAGKALISNNDRNKQELLFYWELLDELALLENTLNRVLRSLPTKLNITGSSLLTQDEEREVNDALESGELWHSKAY